MSNLLNWYRRHQIYRAERILGLSPADIDTIVRLRETGCCGSSTCSNCPEK